MANTLEEEKSMTYRIEYEKITRRDKIYLEDDFAYGIKDLKDQLKRSTHKVIAIYKMYNNGKAENVIDKYIK